MELLSVFFALAAIVLLYFSNRLYVKKSVIGYRTHMAYYQEANSMRYCGMIGLLAAVLFVKAWIGFTLLAFVAVIFHLFVFKKIKKHKRSCDIALRDNESDKEKAHKAALNDYQNWLRHFFLCFIVIAIVAVIIKSYC